MHLLNFLIFFHGFSTVIPSSINAGKYEGAYPIFSVYPEITLSVNSLIFSVLLLSIVAYVIDLFIYTDPDLAWADKIIAFIETFLPSVLMPFLTIYVLLCCGENIRKSALFYPVTALCAALFILLVITQFTDFIYYFTQDNQFVRGKGYWVLIALMIA